MFTQALRSERTTRTDMHDASILTDGCSLLLNVTVQGLAIEGMLQDKNTMQKLMSCTGWLRWISKTWLEAPVVSRIFHRSRHNLGCEKRNP